MRRGWKNVPSGVVYAARWPASEPWTLKVSHFRSVMCDRRSRGWCASRHPRRAGTCADAAFPRRWLGSNGPGFFSHDGKWLAYRFGGGKTPSKLAIRSLENGQEREIEPLGAFGLWGWHPDGRSLLATGNPPTGQRGVYKIDIDRGKATLLLAEPPKDVNMQFMAWSGDGSKIYYRRSEPKATRLMAHNVATGEEKEMFRYHDQFFSANLAVSPDGRQLAFGSKGALLVIPAEGGAPRVVVPEPKETRLGPRGIAWGADGRFLYYFAEEKGDNHPTHLFRAYQWRKASQRTSASGAKTLGGCPFIRTAAGLSTPRRETTQKYGCSKTFVDGVAAMQVRVISHYELLDKVGEGGMAVVYKARDVRLDRFVALKCVAPHLVDSPQTRRRLVDEARALSSLNHAYIATIYDVIEDEGAPVLVMEYLPGGTLRSRTGGRQLASAELT